MKPGWTTVGLGDVVNFVSGGTPSRANEAFYEGELPWITGADITEDGMINPRRFLTRAAVDAGKTGVIGPGDLALVTRTSVGKVAIAEGPLAFSQDVTGLRLHASVDSNYLAHFLRSREPELSSQARGATIKGVNRRVVSALQVPLPTLDEQRYIAAILDKAASLIALRAQQGELARSLAAALFRVRSSGAGNQVRLGEVASFIRGVTFKPADKVEAGEGAVAVMRTKNVQTTLDRSDEIHIPRVLVKNPNKYLREKDILVSSANSWNLVGRSCYVNELASPAVIGGFVTALRVHEDFSPEWLYAWFSSAEVQATLRSFSSQTTNIANLNLKRTLELRVPVPRPGALEAFKRATNRIAGEMAIIATAQRTEQELFASLQSRAFRGDL